MYNNCSKLKYYNQTLIKINSYSNTPIIYKKKYNKNIYICNDFYLIHYTDMYNNLRIPGLGHINTLISQCWSDLLYFKNNNILSIDNLIICKSMKPLDIKFFITNTNNLNLILNTFFCKNNIKKKINITNSNKYLFEQKYLIIFNNNWDIIELDSNSIYYTYLGMLSYKLFLKQLNICNSIDLELNGSLFEYGINSKSDIFYLINQPYNIDNSVYNINQLNNLSNILSINNINNVLNYHKTILNKLKKNIFYKINVNKSININHEIYNYYLKKNIFFYIIHSLNSDEATKLKNIFNKEKRFYISDYINSQKFDQYTSKNIIPILILNNHYDLSFLDKFNNTIIMYDKSYKNKLTNNKIIVDKISDIYLICNKINKIK